ncbi:MAG: EAL domain-containing protein, partial [Micromonosporaceae bacterium]|nr:EAL domain-containing protein [Micromonosporaceae bacterium]
GLSQDTTARVRAFNEVSARWNLAFTHLSTEDAVLREFLATGGSVHKRQTLRDVVGSVNADLEWLEHHGGRIEAEHVAMLRVEYDGYTKVMEFVLSSPEKSERLTVYGDLALMEFGSLRAQIGANVERKQREFVQYLVGVDQDNLRLRWGAVAVVAVDLLLCIASMVVLVTYQRRAEREASSSRHQALHDALTGLANRQLLADRIEIAIREADHTDRLVGLLLIDLDRFKIVNDTLGHHYGDVLLCQVAERLIGSSRKTDTVARLGGDEFAVLLPDMDSVEDLPQIAEELRRAIQQPVELNGMLVDFGASVGASIFPRDSFDGEELLRHADVAMYVAKRGGFGVNVYDPRSDVHDPMALSILSELRHSINHGHLVLYYQPKVAVADRSLLGVEALVRWQHPSRGLLAPDAFLAIAERGEIIEELTDEVLRIAISQAGAWAGLGLRLPVSVNVTARSLLDPTFSTRLAQLLEQHGVSPDMLTIELPESAISADPALAAKALQEIRTLGVRASIDDFGTGFSSMTFLRDAAVDELKIDRGFVTTMRTDERNHVLVKTMILMARTMAVGVIAEGVEDELTLETLSGLGCQAVQGYHICEPMPAEALSRWLDRCAPGMVVL